MFIRTLVVGPLQTNCYVIADRTGRTNAKCFVPGSGAVIDPGGVETLHCNVSTCNVCTRIVAAAAGLKLCYVINTHAHFDHVMGNRELLEAFAAQNPPPELVVHAQAAPLLAAGGGARMFGFSMPASPLPDRLVGDGDELVLGSLKLQVLHTPGHSPGGISLYCAAEGVVFVGDVLFRRGIGRFDLPGGSWPVLEESIRGRLFALPEETVVYPGHGPPTTIGEEQRDNPYLS